MSSLSRFLKNGLGIGTEAQKRELTKSVQLIAERLASFEPERAHFLAAFAYILARVAHADMRIEPAEIEEMERSIRGLAELPEREAAVVVELAISQADDLGGTDDYLVTREFRKLADRATRARLMRALLAVAAADDSIGSAESREILSVGEELGFTRLEINGLRLEWRDKLAELSKLPSET